MNWYSWIVQRTVRLFSYHNEGRTDLQP
jgi:hypothetical protein